MLLVARIPLLQAGKQEPSSRPSPVLAARDLCPPGVELPRSEEGNPFTRLPVDAVIKAARPLRARLPISELGLRQAMPDYDADAGDRPSTTLSFPA